MSNILIVKNKDMQQQQPRHQQQQLQAHQHYVTYDYENGEKICKLCGIVVQDKLAFLN